MARLCSVTQFTDSSRQSRRQSPSVYTNLISIQNECHGPPTLQQISISLDIGSNFVTSVSQGRHDPARIIHIHQSRIFTFKNTEITLWQTSSSLTSPSYGRVVFYCRQAYTITILHSKTISPRAHQPV